MQVGKMLNGAVLSHLIMAVGILTESPLAIPP